MGVSAAVSFLPFLLCGTLSCAIARSMAAPDRGPMISFGAMMTELGLFAIGLWLLLCAVASMDDHPRLAGRVLLALLLVLVGAVVIWLHQAWRGGSDDDDGLDGGGEPEPDPPAPEPHYADWDGFDAWRDQAAWDSFDAARDSWATPESEPARG